MKVRLRADEFSISRANGSGLLVRLSDSAGSYVILEIAEETARALAKELGRVSQVQKSRKPRGSRNEEGTDA